MSDNRQELIGIDAGTRPDSAKTAYEALRAYAPNLPELTTIFITHSHWDHVGGHTYFRTLNPPVRFYARSNYAEEIAHDLKLAVAGLARAAGVRKPAKQPQRRSSNSRPRSAAAAADGSPDGDRKSAGRPATAS